MADALMMSYSSEADVLTVWKTPSNMEPWAEDVGDLVIARRNRETGVIEQLEILGFLKRLGQSRTLQLPVSGNLEDLVRQFGISEAAE